MEKTITEIFSLKRESPRLGKIPFSLKSFLKIGAITASVIIITLFHYQTAPEAGIKHVVYRELYFLPIILGGFWYGLRGGLLTALTISIFYSPMVLSEADTFSTHNFGNIMEILLFNLVGALLGLLKDRENVLQKRTSEAENLAAMGQAAAMIAHDLKTPLVTIGGLARRLTHKIPQETPEGEKVRVIRQQSERLEQLVMDILLFAKPIKLSMKENNLCQLLQNAKDSASGIAKENGIEVIVHTEKECRCTLDDEKMMQVFINLLANAIESSLPGETVTISLANNAGTLQVDISDRGVGIPENIMDKIFEPFVSGKPKGTGLGLPISKKIVEAHAGKLEYVKNNDSGTTFRILIPAK